MSLMKAKQKELLAVLMCFLVVAGLFMPGVMAQPPRKSSNTHKFKNTFDGTYDDLHVEYSKAIDADDPKFTTAGGAHVEGWEAIGKTLTVWGTFPPGSSVTVTVYSDKRVVPTSYYWTLGGQQVGPKIPVLYVTQWITNKKSGKFEYKKTVDKPNASVNVDVKGAVNIEGGAGGVKVVKKAKNGKTEITISATIKDKSKKAGVSMIIDPPDEILDLALEIELAVEIKGLFGVAVSILNIGNESVENLTWSVDLSGLIFIGKHSDGTIGPLASGATESVGPPLVFGIGSSTITAAIGNATATATSFVLGPFVLGVKQTP